MPPRQYEAGAKNTRNIRAIYGDSIKPHKIGLFVTKCRLHNTKSKLQSSGSAEALRRKAYSGAVYVLRLRPIFGKNNVEKYKFIYAIYAKYTRLIMKFFYFVQNFRNIFMRIMHGYIPVRVAYDLF